MNLIDMRIFSTQLMLYLKTSCHSMTTHINGLYLGSNHLCRGICVNFIKTISHILRNNVIDNMKHVWFISVMYRHLCHWSRGNTFYKKSSLTLMNQQLCLQVSNVQKNPGQVGFCTDK